MSSNSSNMIKKLQLTKFIPEEMQIMKLNKDKIKLST